MRNKTAIKLVGQFLNNKNMAIKSNHGNGAYLGSGEASFFSASDSFFPASEVSESFLSLLFVFSSSGSLIGN